jgi:hypothetical protein
MKLTAQDEHHIRAAGGWLDLDHKPDHTHVIAATLTEQLPEIPENWFYLACACARLNQYDEAGAVLKRCFIAAA